MQKYQFAIKLNTKRPFPLEKTSVLKIIL